MDVLNQLKGHGRTIIGGAALLGVGIAVGVLATPAGEAEASGGAEPADVMLTACKDRALLGLKNPETAVFDLAARSQGEFAGVQGSYTSTTSGVTATFQMICEGTVRDGVAEITAWRD